MKASIEVIAKITSIPSVGMIFRMLIHIAWFIMPTMATKILGMSTHMSPSTSPSRCWLSF